MSRPAIFLDFWNTLWSPQLAHDFRALSSPQMKDLPAEFTDVTRNLHEVMLREYETFGLPRPNIPQIARRFGGALLPGAVTLLQLVTLKADIVVVSYSPKELMDEIFQATALTSTLSYVLGVDPRSPGGKAEAMREVISKLEGETKVTGAGKLMGPITSLTMVGDSLGDQVAARKIGADFIHLGARGSLANGSDAIFSTESLFKVTRFILRNVLGDTEIHYGLGSLGQPKLSGD